MSFWFTPDDPFQTNQMIVGALHAMSGDTEKSMAALRRAAVPGGLNCTRRLRDFPYYDNLRDEPAFARLIAEQEARIAAQRHRLADDGLLLTPEEVLQLDDFPYIRSGMGKLESRRVDLVIPLRRPTDLFLPTRQL